MSESTPPEGATASRGDARTEEPHTLADGPPAVELAPPAEAADVIRFSARWWWDHSGRIAGALIALFVVALLVLLAVGGDSAAGVLLALVAAGVAMIAVGGRIHGR